jgi:arylsulfatase A-like enzyme/predicted Zn-dependent protease
MRPPHPLDAGIVIATLASILIVASGVACRGSHDGATRESADGNGASAAIATGSGDSSLVVFTLDTTRADRTTPYGAPPEATPNLEALARAGTVLEHAYAIAPITLPAHATLFTGETPARHGVRQNGIHHLPDDAVTLAEVLHDAGFATAAFVSAAVLERRYGLAQGFDLYDDEPTSTRTELGRYAERPAKDTVDRALQWLDALPAGRRFYLWVHLFDPHAVYAPPPPFAAAWAGKPYEGEIAYMDAEIGRLLAHPRLARDVYVAALADHGESLGEHGEANHGMLLYDAVLHVPWIVRGPGIAAGRRLAPSASQLDLFPTALALLGVNDGGKRSGGGWSWARALAGESVEPPPRSIYAETFAPFYSYGWAALRTLQRGGWKLIDAPAPELYDLASDPAEAHNRIAAGRDATRTGASVDATARELGRELADLAAADPGPAPGAAPDADAASKLRSLGYVSGAGSRSARATRPDPKTMIDVHREFSEAQEALNRGEARAAATALDAVLARDPDNPAALESKATALARLDRLPEADATLARARALDPTSVTLTLESAQLRAQAGDLEQAAALAERAAGADQTSAEARVAAARYLAALGKNDAAAARAREAFALAPHQALVEIIYADLVLRAQGDVAGAEERLRRVVEHEPLLPEGWLALGRVVEQARGAPEAIAIYREGLQRQPEAGELHAALGVLMAQQRQPGAEEHLERAAALLHPAPASVHRALALAAIGRRDWKRAEREARAALESNRDDASAWTLLAAALEEQKRIDDALAAYDDARRADPRHLPALFNRALLLRRIGRYRDSADQLQRVLEIDGANAAAHYELGVLYGGPLHDPAAARRELELALANGHPDPAAIRRLLDALPRT